MTRTATPFSVVFEQRVEDLANFGVRALGPLYDLTAKRLVRYASMVTRQQQDAEDAVQAALIKLARRPTLLAHAKAPWPYLLRMVRNEALLNGRRQARVYPSDNLSDMVTYCRVDELEQEDTYRQIWQALRQLPRTQSEVIALKTWESMTFAQIAIILDISSNTAASRYRYGIAKLTTLLADMVEETCDA